MQYYEQDDRRRRVWGIVAAVLYLAVCAGLMFVTYTISLPEPELGILVDFGTSDTGTGEDDLAAGEVDVRPATPQPETPADPILTTEEPDAPEVAPEPEPRPVQAPTPPAPEPAPARRPDSRALFPGRTEGSNAASQGTAGGEGNQGTQQGSPGGSDTAGGSGSSGFSLDGRYLAGRLPSPLNDHKVEGRIVISIVVDAKGVVTNAVFQQKGSTSIDGELVTKARNAAMKARFSERSDGKTEPQTGTITYDFTFNSK